MSRNSDQNTHLFIGFSINFLTSDWHPNSHTIGCAYLSPRQILNLSKTNTALSSFIDSKYNEICHKFKLNTSRIFKIIFDSNHKQLNTWNAYQHWSLPGMEILDKKFFSIDFSCSNDKNMASDEFVTVDYDYDEQVINLYFIKTFSKKFEI